MKRLMAVATGILVALLAAAPVSAGPASGTIVLSDPAPASGSTLYVDVSIKTSYLVVAYEYAIQNECTFPSRTGKSLQRDDIVYWTYEDGGVPHTVMPIYLQSVPEGSKCKVFLAKNNVVVKGTTTAYTVGPPLP